MKSVRLFITFFWLIIANMAFSQIRYGGAPHFIQPSILRVASANFFIEMPPFDLDSVLREDSINERNMRGSYRFAYKFFTHIDLNDAVSTVLPDGTTVRQIGIHSAGAYSINLLLSDFELPQGGKLFVYNADHSQVVGSFDYRNNSSEKILPIQPVTGESIIVEYSEPADVPFKGHFIISEVNHDYRDIFRAEPQKDKVGEYDCMQDVFCSDASDETIRSTVLLVINGNTLCSGVLLNNTADDGKPYLLTGNHCLCNPSSYPQSMDYYNGQASTIIAFFNYNRPVCDVNIKMKGSEEMSLAGAYARVINERKDVALLEFSEPPPDYFNAYYAGWNLDLNASGKHTNVHHPSGAVKKYGMTVENISLSTVPAPDGSNLDPNSYWTIPSWTIGSTYPGSSGSPLFDENNLVIGGLTGGTSVCSGTSPSAGTVDYFSSLGKSWDSPVPAKQLRAYLDPANTGVTQYQGKDPNQINPIIRLANARYTGGDLLITSVLDSPNTGFVFGNSNLQTLEFAEKFQVANPVKIFGVYLLIPAMQFDDTSGVTISVYTGTSSPETKIYSTPFVPQYTNYSSTPGFYPANKTFSTVPTESFVVFDQPVIVTDKNFFISYSINYSTSAQFCVYNTNFQDASQPNTAWLKNEATGWVSADAYRAKPMKTSLAIQPLIQSSSGNKIETPSVAGENDFWYDRSGRMLTLKEPMNTQGQIAIYSVAGQLLEKIQIQPGQTAVILREQPKGTIGIAKITGVNFSSAGKIMY